MMNERQKKALPANHYIVWRYVPGQSPYGQDDWLTLVSAKGITRGFFCESSNRHEANDGKGYRTITDIWFAVSKEVTWEELEANPQLLGEYPINGYSLERIPHNIRKAFILAKCRYGDRYGVNWVFYPECPPDIDNTDCVWVTDETEIPRGILSFDEVFDYVPD